MPQAHRFSSLFPSNFASVEGQYPNDHLLNQIELHLPIFNITLLHRNQLCKSIIMGLYINAATVLSQTMKNAINS